jgi:hypothetical protein
VALGKVIQRIEIEMSGGTKQYMVSAKQGDRATRYVETVLLNHGEPYTIPAGSSVTAFIRKPDRHRVYTPCEFTDNVVMVELDSQALAAAGTALCEVEVKSSDLMQVVTSVTFEIEIEAKVKDEDAIVSGDELSIFDKTMKQYADQETKRVNAEKSRVSAESDRVTAEQERQKQANEALDKANEAVKIAGQINEASYMLDKDENIKYAYAIYTERGIPHLALTPINE